MVVVVAKAPAHRDTEFVFRTWINNTGWESNVICFITGLVNPLYSLGGLDGITHITEEMPNVRHQINPKHNEMLIITAFSKCTAGHSNHSYYRICYWICLPYSIDVLSPGLFCIGIDINGAAPRRAIPASDYYRWRSICIDFHAMDCVGSMHGGLPAEYRKDVLGIFQGRSLAIF